MQLAAEMWQNAPLAPCKAEHWDKVPGQLSSDLGCCYPWWKDGLSPGSSR